MKDIPEHLKFRVGNLVEFSAHGRLAIVTGTLLALAVLAWAALS